MLFLFIKIIHIAGAIVIFGTGTGIAFFMLMAHRSGHTGHIARTAATVVIADALFTASAVVLQPISGAALIHLGGHSWHEPWLIASLVLYGVAGLFWLPVVKMQIDMRDLARAAERDGTALPQRYFHLFRLWFWFGFPGFGAVAAILLLMVFKPW